MKVNEIPLALMSFAENYVIPNITGDGDRFLSYTGLFLYFPKIESMVQQNIDVLRELNIVMDDDTVNIAALKEAGLKTFDKMQKVKLWKFTFDKTDFEKFIEYINR